MGKDGNHLMYRTAISKALPDDVVVRGYSLRSLIGDLSIAGMCYLLIKGDRPDRNAEKMLDAILVACSEHGVRPPSIQAARQIASGGVQFQACVAGGILALGDSHGGAIEEAMVLFDPGLDKIKGGMPIQEVAEQILSGYKARKQRLPGFGHPTHAQDPRTTRLFDLARELGIFNDACRLAESIADQSQAVMGRKLPLNVDGGIAAILTEMNFDPRVGKGIFSAGRIFGIIAHVLEEKVREKPMAHLPAFDMIQYDGRELEP